MVTGPRPPPLLQQPKAAATADLCCNSRKHGEIKRGREFIEGDELFEVQVETSFCAGCSPMDVMFLVDNGRVVEDMRPRFVHELLKMDCAEFERGKVPATARESCLLFLCNLRRLKRGRLRRGAARR